MTNETTHTETEIALAEMLTESTGTHFLDSGGAAGRAWQRNQAEVEAAQMTPAEFFKAQPDAWFGWPVVGPHENFREGKDPADFRAELWITVSVFHWLNEVADVRPEWDALFQQYADLPENEDQSWLALAYEDGFPEYHAKVVRERIQQRMADEGEPADEVAAVDVTVKGGWYDGEHASTGYTYNDENTLSQDIHYTLYGLEITGSNEMEFEEDESIAIISIHGGADARGGFTKPRVMSVDVMGEGGAFGFFDYNTGSIYCDGDCRVRWDLRDGYNGYDCAGKDLPNLNEIPAIEGDKGEVGTIVIHQPDEVQYPGEGTVVFCPLCATGHLKAGLY